MPFNSQGYLMSNSSPLPSHSTPSPASDAVDHPKTNMYHSHPHMNGKPVQVCLKADLCIQYVCKQKAKFINMLEL